MKTALWISLAVMLGITVGMIEIPNAFAHEPNFSVKTTEDILKFCEFFYDEYLFIGEKTLAEQHPNYPNLRACGILYNHIAWKSTHPGRDIVLIAEIEKYLGDAAYIKERHIKNSNSIPKWMKNDAKMWANGETTDVLFVYGIRDMLENNIFNPSLKNNKNCNEKKLCIIKSDFMKYSYSNKYGQYSTEKYIVDSINKDEIIIKTEKKSKDKKEFNSIKMDKNGTILADKKCCVIKKFIFLPTINLGDMITDNLSITGETTQEFDGKIRQVWIAQDLAKQNTVIIDKKTGLVLSDNYNETGLTIKWEKIELLETNVFEKKYVTGEFVVPKWFKTITKWWANDLISESEFIKATENLLERGIIRV
ncbi:MAG: hypothetical protein ACE5RL_04625 [Nitrosarchaeum sp.]